MSIKEICRISLGRKKNKTGIVDLLFWQMQTQVRNKRNLPYTPAILSYKERRQYVHCHTQRKQQTSARERHLQPEFAQGFHLRFCDNSIEAKPLEDRRGFVPYFELTQVHCCCFGVVHPNFCAKAILKRNIQNFQSHKLRHSPKGDVHCPKMHIVALLATKQQHPTDIQTYIQTNNHFPHHTVLVKS